MKRVIVRLERNITESTELPEQFQEELSWMLGVPREEFHEPHLRAGCTLFDTVADKQAVESLVASFEEYRSGTLGEGPEAQLLRQFIARWSVEVLTDDIWTKGAIEPVRPPPVECPTIVMVHGWGGNREDTFGKLPDFLSTALGEFSTLVYEYPSSWLKKSPSVVFVARNLDNWIRNRTADARVAVLGHSLGGLVARYLAVMQSARRKPLDLRQVTLVASPTNGAALARIAEYVPVLRKAQIRELQSNSPFLVDLNDRWAIWKSTFVPDSCHLGTIYGLDDHVVDYASAIGSDPEAVPLFGADHVGIVKPKSADDEIVLTVTRFLREAGLAN